MRHHLSMVAHCIDQSFCLSGNQIALIKDMLQLMPHIQFHPQRFAELARQLVQHWQNQSRSKPMNQLFSRLSALLQPLNPDPELLADQLSRVLRRRLA